MESKFEEEKFKHSTGMMRTLYFLKRDNPDLNCGIINFHDEVLREVFENAGLPQTIYIVDGRPYYL